MASGNRNMVASDAQPDETARVLAELREENARLREELEQSGKGDQAAEREGLAKAARNTPRTVKGPDGDIEVPEGVFLSEGLRVDLERNGRAIDPLTGAKVGGPWPVEK